MARIRYRRDNAYRPNALLSLAHGVVSPIAACMRLAVAAWHVATGSVMVLLFVLLGLALAEGIVRLAFGLVVDLLLAVPGALLGLLGSLVGLG